MLYIKGFEEQYSITENGEVYSHKSKKYLKQSKVGNGYLVVNLCKDGKSKHYLVHRLVAEAFIPNINNLPQVNHKDENKENNCVDNLEWISTQDNLNYGSRRERAGKAISKALKKPIYCLELGIVFDSAKTASEELNLHATAITSVCKGKHKTTGGFHFVYKEVG